MFRLERSPTLGTAAIEDLDDLLSAPEHAGLRRAFALSLLEWADRFVTAETLDEVFNGGVRD